MLSTFHAPAAPYTEVTLTPKGLTENQLQAQIISLQQTVIHILQDALANERPLSQSDMQKLMLASQSAREGSLDALRAQHGMEPMRRAGGQARRDPRVDPRPCHP